MDNSNYNLLAELKRNDTTLINITIIIITIMNIFSIRAQSLVKNLLLEGLSRKTKCN